MFQMLNKHKLISIAYTTIVEIVPFDRNWLKPWFDWKIGSGACSQICVASTQIDILMSFPSWFDLSLTSCWWGTYKYIDERSEANESAFAEVARQFCLGSMRVDALMSFSIFVRPLWSLNDGASSDGLWQCVEPWYPAVWSALPGLDWIYWRGRCFNVFKDCLLVHFFPF